MTRPDILKAILTCLALLPAFGPAQAIDLLQAVEAKDYQRVMGEVSGLEMADDGTVYVTSSEQATLLRVNDGNIEATSLYPSVFMDTDLGGVAQMADGRLVVVNQGDGQVAILDSGLQPRAQFSRSGDDPGELDEPGPVVSSVNGNIFVGDTRNRRVSIFNQQGLFLYTVGQDGGDAELLGLAHLDIDAEENLYILENSERLSIYDVGGKLIARFTANDLQDYFGETPEFTAMATDLDGNLYLGDYVQSRVTVFDWRNLEVLGQVGALGHSRGQFREISFLSVNERGQLAVADRVSRKLEIYQLEQTRFATPVTRDRLWHGLTIEAGCVAQYAFIDDQTLCVLPEKQGIRVLAADGGDQGVFAEAIRNPAAIHVGAGSVAILEGHNLHAYGHDGKLIFSIGRYGSSPGGFNKPANVFVHGGRYFVADTGNNRIQVFRSDGIFEKEITAGDGENRRFFEVGPIAVDSEENLYVADSSRSGAIHVIDRDGNRIGEISHGKKSVYRADRYYAIDIDLQDRLYVLAGSSYSDAWVRIYRDLELYRSFGAAEDSATPMHFEEASSLSVSSAARNSVFVTDGERGKTFRIDLLEYPDPAFGLKVAANRQSIELSWSSSRSPLIERYEIEAGYAETGPFLPLAASDELRQTLSVQSAGEYSWFRVVSVSAHGLRGKPSAPRENHFRSLQSLYEAGDYAAAVKLAERLLKVAPDNADARDLLATSLFQQRDYARSISEFKPLEDVGPYRIKAIQYQVQAYYELEQYLEARTLIDEVIEQEPAEVEPYLICARLSLELADAVGAVGCAEDGLEKHEDNVKLRYLLGRAYIEAGIHEDGLLEYRRIVDSSPGNTVVRLMIAQDLYRMGDYQEALGHYQAVLAQSPQSGPATVGKARSLLALGRDDEAKAIAVKMSGKKETRATGYYLLGKIAAQNGKHKEAVLRLTRAGKDGPGVVDVWVSLAASYLEINQPEKAVKSLEQGIATNPDAFALYRMAGKIELDRENFPAANGYFEQAVLLAPQSLDAHRWYAQSLYATRNYRLAAIHAEIAADLAGDDVGVLVLQADIANQQGKTGSAVEFLKTAISIDTASPELQYRIGRVYQDANLFDASREHLERAAAIRPNWAAPHVALGNLYSKRRLFDDAIASFEQAVELEPSAEHRAMLDVAFAERKKSLEFEHNAPQLVLSNLKLKTVFSAAYKNYQDKPIGSVTLRNVGGTDYGNLKLSFQIREFMDFPTTVDISRIDASQDIEIPIRATFNNRILDVDEDTGVQVEVKLTYLRDGRKDDITLTQPMTIYGKNAMVWGNAQMIGSFVTPKDDTLRDYVRQVVNAYLPEPGPLNRKMVSAMTFFSSLSAAGVNYIVDPNTPFAELSDDQVDYVQFPRETLRLKSGDCDDLSVLISAGLENLGIRTAFVEVPGHLFLMFDTGLGVDQADLISQDGSLLATRNGTVWIPLEATMVNTSFNEAWAEGARRYQAALAASELGIIDLSEAWNAFQPVTLRKADYSIDLPDAQRTRNLVDRSRQLMLGKSIDRLVLPYQTMVDNNPENVAARLQIAILYARYGLYQDAEIAFESLNELAPSNSAVMTNQGNLYFLQEDFDNAMKYYRRAIEIDSDDGGIWINLSMAQFKAGDLKEARNSYQNAVKLDTRLRDEFSAYSKLLSN